MTDVPPWWMTGVIYHIYPRSFQDTTDSGIGDLPGITRRLDYLVGTLGIDAIWISPFYPSPMADFGYDVSDYTDVHPLFGTLADFDELVAEANARELRVIIDWVPNHSSDQHHWFQAARSSRDDPKRDWYLWHDPDPDGSPPNNWLAAFGGSAWEWEEATGQYYLHSFLKEQPDLNWRNPQLRAAMFDTIRFWLDRGADGFRVDVAHFVMKDPELRDNPTAPGSDLMPHSGPAYETQDHVHDKAHPDSHDVYREMRAILNSYGGDRFAIGEISLDDLDRWAAYYGDELDQLNMPFNFTLLTTPWEAAAVQRSVEAIEAVVPDGGWPNFVLGNHDTPRPVRRLGQAHARIGAMLLLTLRGTPTLYYGDELGMDDVDVAPGEMQDPWEIRVPGKGRDGCRSPMLWNPEPGRGFTGPGVRPWLPFLENLEINVATQLDEPISMLNLYRALLKIRRASTPLRLGSYRALPDVPGQVYGYTREDQDETVAILLNFGDTPCEVNLAGHEHDVWLSTSMDRSGLETEPLTLRPNEGLIVREAPVRQAPGTSG
jgi:glycosidase